jgi:hypothetical protein
MEQDSPGLNIAYIDPAGRLMAPAFYGRPGVVCGAGYYLTCFFIYET